jgi:hypothetical protein
VFVLGTSSRGSSASKIASKISVRDGGSGGGDLGEVAVGTGAVEVLVGEGGNSCVMNEQLKIEFYLI